jgi:hypothetical protein
VPRAGASRLLLALAAAALLTATACSSSDEQRLTGSCFEHEPRAPAANGTVGCDTGRFEVVSFDTLDGSDEAAWPGTFELSRATFDRCLDAAETYAGRPLPEAGLDIWIHYPSEDAWRAGDRDFVCAIQRLDGSPLGGSTEGETV